ncbi:MAG: hypothetical protein M0R66_00370 [Candidatus Omnitrophica bacterium]|nr:hypothetical protein [Candidatus Omnitrophota bacterium]
MPSPCRNHIEEELAAREERAAEEEVVPDFHIEDEEVPDFDDDEPEWEPAPTGIALDDWVPGMETRDDWSDDTRAICDDDYASEEDYSARMSWIKTPVGGDYSSDDDSACEVNRQPTPDAYATDDDSACEVNRQPTPEAFATEDPDGGASASGDTPRASMEHFARPIPARAESVSHLLGEDM